MILADQPQPVVSIAQTARGALDLPYLRRLSPLWKTVAAVGVYATWTAVTWFLEGRIQTSLRPEAVADRLIYTGVANLLIGSILALLVVAEFVDSLFR